MARYTRPSLQQAATLLSRFRLLSLPLMTFGSTQCNTVCMMYSIRTVSLASFILPVTISIHAHSLHVKMINPARRSSIPMLGGTDWLNFFVRPWGNGGSPWEGWDNSESPTWPWWNETTPSSRQETYGGYQLLDFVGQDPPVLNLRDTGNSWFSCTRATRAPCTDVAGIVVNYLYDCKPGWSPKVPEVVPGGSRYNGGLNNGGYGDDCGSTDDNGAIGILAEAVKEKYINSDITALTGQPIYCNDNNGPDICAFYRGIATGNGSLTASLLSDMHGVLGSNRCGSIPVWYPGKNNEAYGFLTVGQIGSEQDCYPATRFTLNDPTGKIKGTAWACNGFPYE